VTLEIHGCGFLERRQHFQTFAFVQQFEPGNRRQILPEYIHRNPRALLVYPEDEFFNRFDFGIKDIKKRTLLPEL